MRAVFFFNIRTVCKENPAPKRHILKPQLSYMGDLIILFKGYLLYVQAYSKYLENMNSFFSYPSTSVKDLL